MTAKSLLLIVNFNHEREIADLLARVRRALASMPAPVDPVVIDDCSTDGSPVIAASMGFHVIRHSRNSGVGAAIRSGLRHGLERGYENVVMISANGKMQPEEIAKVLQPVTAGAADYAQGSRFKRGGRSDGLSLFRWLAIPAFSLATSLVLGRRFSDITCGFRAYRLDWLRDPEIHLDQGWLDRYELEYYVHYWACRKKLRIAEVPVTILYSHLERGRRSYIKPVLGWWSMTRPFLYLALGIKK